MSDSARTSDVYFDEAAKSFVGDAWIWVLLAPVGLATVALFIVGLQFLVRSGPLRKLRKADRDVPWYEFARAAAPIRTSIGFGLAVFPFLAALLGKMLAWPVPTWMANLTGLLAFLVVGFAMAEMGRGSESWITGRTRSRRVWRRDRATYSLLFAPHAYLLIAGFLFIPGGWGAPTWIGIGIAAVAWWAVFHAGVSYWMLEKLGLIKPPEPRLAKIAERAQEETGISAGRVIEIGWSVPNAVAIDQKNAIGMTTGALEIFDDEEAHAVLCHELGHVADFPEMRTQSLLRAWMVFPLVAARPIVIEFGFWTLLAIYAVILLVAKRFQRSQRKWEFRADEEAATAAAPEVHGRALEKMYRHSLIPAVNGKKPGGTHPDLYDRLVELGCPPDYSRPLPPKRSPFLAPICFGLLVFLVVMILRNDVVKFLAGPDPKGKSWLLPVMWRDSDWKREVILARVDELEAGGELVAVAEVKRAVSMMPRRHWRDFLDAAEASLAAGQIEHAEQFTEWADAEYYHTVGDLPEAPGVRSLRERLGAQ